MPSPQPSPRSASRHPELHARFAEPRAAFSPVPLWWWSGDEVTEERLAFQLEQLAGQGVRNAVVMNLAPTGPLYGSPADRPHFLTDTWWERFEFACGTAQRLGVRLWFYDQIGFSGANLQGDLVARHPEWAGWKLARATAEGTGAEVRSGAVRPECPAEGREVGLSAVPLAADGTAAGPPVAVGAIDPDSAERYRVSLAYTVREGFDYFSADGCGALLNTVHGAFEQRLGTWFGSVIVGSFQDELPSMPSWGDGFAEAFEQRCGYACGPLLAGLWEDAGEESERLRGDYHRLRAALGEEAFFRPLHAWHERHGLLTGFDQQGPARSGEPGGGAELYGDYLRTHRWYSAPGTDHHGSGKVHSSLAHHYGRPRSWIEAFHSSGWGGTLEETFDWLLPWLAAGSNLYDPHAVYYSTRGGWYEWAPPSTCWRQPYWRHYGVFADTVSRLCGALTEGRHVCRAAVLYPGATAQAGTLLAGGEAGSTGSSTGPALAAHAAYFALAGDEEWFRTVPGALGRLGVDFDVLDDDTAARARVSGTELRTDGEAYRTVLVPGCAVLEGATALRLLQFAQAGGRLVFVGPLPERAAAGPSGEFGTAGAAAVEQLRGLVGAGAVRHVPYRYGTAGAAEALDAALGAVLDGGDRPVEAPVPTLARRLDDGRVLVFATAGSATAHPMGDGPVRADGHTWTHKSTDLRRMRADGIGFDPSRYADAARLRIAGRLADVEQWDPVTGTAAAAAARWTEDGRTEVDVDFASAPAVVVVGRAVEDTAGSTPDSSVPADSGSLAPFPAPLRGAPVRGAGLVTCAAPPRGASEPTSAGPAEGRNDPAPTAIPLNGPWHSDLVHTVDNRHGDLALPAEPMDTVDAWTADHTVDRGRTHRRALAGIGTRAWWFGPADPARLPDPLPPEAAREPGLAAALRGPGAKAVRYSLSRGIEKDPVHRPTLGPSGYVPEEFWHVGRARAGQAVQLRTTLPPLPAGRSDLHLAVGAPGRKAVWWNGERLPEDPGGYLRLDPVAVSAGGPNLLEVRVTAEEDGPLRGHWCLTSDPEAFRRPEWITPSTPVRKATSVRISTTLGLPAEPAAATVQFGTIGPCALRVNGVEVGRQGAFDPYPERPHHRVVPYEVAEQLHAGANTVEAVFTDPGTFPVALLVDGVVTLPDGAERTLVSDASWRIERDGVAEVTALRRAQHGDPRFSHLVPRPHPLPRTSWLEQRAGAETVLDLEPEAFPGAAPVLHRFRIEVPPGAHTAELPEPIASAPTLRARLGGGDELPVDGGVLALPRAAEPGRVLHLDVHAPGDAGHGGALLAAPVRFRCGRGALPAGPWDEHGLASFAGGVRYSRTLDVDDPGRPAVLDLGRVRGTAEVSVNGRPAGVRVWSPYRFELTGLLREGANELSVTVLGTLAPYLDDASPTPYVLPGQRTAGLLGPVVLHRRSAN